MRLIDVRHLGTEKVIGCWEVDGVLIDPGPTSSLEALIEALEGEPRAVLLTHIHLDHGGGAGALVGRWPELQVYVHQVGAPHLADPKRLLASAERLYGEEMDRLWGPVMPIPERNLHPLTGGEEILGFEVAYTPGHASHHVSYFHRESGRAFVGDTAGVRIPPAGYVLPPTPPPDIDLELWNRSLDTILDWSPATLGITHFGELDNPPAHLELMRQRLREQLERARATDGEEFERALVEEVEREAGEVAPAMLQAVPPDQQWPGLNRYLEKTES